MNAFRHSISVATAPVMKRNSSVLLGLLGTGLLLLAASHSLAQSSGKPPTQLTYQGFLTDGSGVPVGNTAPVNKTLILRIYDAPAGGTLKWSSQQIVTVDKGYFSALLGQGNAVGSDPFSADLSAVFTGPGASDRYLELNADGATIAPRLRFLPAPYAMLAKSATELLDPIYGTNSLSISSGNLTVGGTINGNNVNVSNLGASGNITAGGNILGYSLFAASSITSHAQQGAYLEWNKDGYNGMSYLLNQRGSGGGGIVFGEVSTANAITERMRLDGSGNVGIGTIPGSKFHVAGGDFQLSGGGILLDNSKSLKAKNTAGGYETFLVPRDTDNITYMNYGSSGFNLRNNGSTSTMFMDNSGNVGIGTLTPANKLTVSGNANFTGKVGIGTSSPSAPLSVTANGPYDGYVTVQGVHMGPNGNVNTSIEVVAAAGGQPYIDFKIVGGNTDYGARLIYNGDDLVLNGADLYLDNGIYCQFSSVRSDERIKDVLGRSLGSQDLNTLLALQVTDYRLKEGRTVSAKVQKKLIAQEVEKVYPQAISQSRGYIPDIRQDAAFENGWLTLKTDLKVGDRVRLLVGDRPVDHEVLETNDTGFRTGLITDAKMVFVYGRQVKDFRYVEYDAIAMLNVSATQELAKQVEALRKSEARIAELELKVSKLDVLERELVEVKKLLTRLAEPRKDGRPAAELPTNGSPAGPVR